MNNDDDVSNTNNLIHNNLTLSNLYKNMKYHDVEFQIINFKSDIIKAHKSILSNASPVFGEIFENTVITHPTNPTEITLLNISYDSLNTIIEYIYTDTYNKQILNNSLKLSDLIESCKLYQIDYLVEKIGYDMMTKINDTNVLNFLNIAIKYNIKSLLKKCLFFVSANQIEILDSGNEMVNFLLKNFSLCHKNKNLRSQAEHIIY